MPERWSRLNGIMKTIHDLRSNFNEEKHWKFSNWNKKIELKNSVTYLENRRERLASRLLSRRILGLKDKVEEQDHMIKEYKNFWKSRKGAWENCGTTKRPNLQIICTEKVKNSGTMA